MSDLHDAVEDLRIAARAVSEAGADLSVHDAAALSDVQLTLAEIVQQVLQVEAIRRDRLLRDGAP